MTFKELYEISSEIHFDLFDEVDGSLGCLSTGPIVDDGFVRQNARLADIGTPTIACCYADC